MQYQLPNGRVVYMTVEQYLDLTDEDIQNLIACNAGDFVNSPFHGSCISQRKKEDLDDEVHDLSIDYNPEEEEIIKEKPIIQDFTEIEDIPDIPEEDSLI